MGHRPLRAGAATASGHPIWFRKATVGAGQPLDRRCTAAEDPTGVRPASDCRAAMHKLFERADALTEFLNVISHRMVGLCAEPLIPMRADISNRLG